MSILYVVGAAIVHDGKCLVAQRGPGMSLPGKWEFPGGKVEPGELPAVALAREIEEEFGLRISVGRLLGSGTSTAGQRTINLNVYAATIVSGDLALREHAQIVWARSHELGDFDWAEADVPCIPGVLEWLQGSAGSNAPRME